MSLSSFAFSSWTFCVFSMIWVKHSYHSLGPMSRKVSGSFKSIFFTAWEKKDVSYEHMTLLIFEKQIQLLKLKRCCLVWWEVKMELIHNEHLIVMLIWGTYNHGDISLASPVCLLFYRLLIRSGGRCPSSFLAWVSARLLPKTDREATWNLKINRKTKIKPKS